MADISLTTATVFRIVESLRQFSAVAGEDLAAGDIVRIVAADAGAGCVVKADASAAGTADAKGIVLKKASSGMAVTVLCEGIVDGYDLTGQGYGVLLYLSDTAGAFGDAAGTTSVKIGYVMPVPNSIPGQAFDKMVYVNFTL
ncbi:MAG: hypothetical protein HF312_15355 [Ignavibacteria bacterium]|jgi:hypothetical protein|nr:hypothetical protein [Ignavibacteria bacterium]